MPPDKNNNNVTSKDKKTSERSSGRESATTDLSSGSEKSELIDEPVSKARQGISKSSLLKLILKLLLVIYVILNVGAAPVLYMCPEIMSHMIFQNFSMKNMRKKAKASEA